MRNNKKFVGVMYALGYLGISIFTQTTVKWYQYYYAPPSMNQAGLRVLVPLSLIGMAMIIARVFDGLADPIVAYLSDSFYSRWGRRIPFIAVGSIPLALTFVLLWFPPIAQQSIWNFVYLSIILSLFFISFTVVVAPYLALIGEITNTGKERISLTMMQGITQVLGVMIAEVGSSALINMYGFRIMGLILGMIGFVTIVLTPIFVTEDISKISKAKEMGIVSSVKLTLSNRNFVYYLMSQGGIWFGINTLTIAMPYITEVLLGRGAEVSGYMIGGAFIVAIVFSFFIPRLTNSWGKKEVMVRASIILAIVLMSTGLFGNVLNMPLSFLVILIAGVPLAAIFVVPNAMVADIAEQDSKTHGKRREGMFFGAQGLVLKVVLGISSFVTPLIFGNFGYTVTNSWGLRLVGPLAGLVVFASIYFLKKYSLTETNLQG